MENKIALPLVNPDVSWHRDSKSSTVLQRNPMTSEGSRLERGRNCGSSEKYESKSEREYSGFIGTAGRVMCGSMYKSWSPV